MKLSNLTVLLATCAVLSFCMGIVYTYMSEYIFSITGSATFTGFLISIRSAICATLFIFGGYIADTSGRKRPLYIGTSLIGISYLFYAFAHTSEELLLATVIEGVAYFYFPAYNAMIMDSTPENMLVRIFILIAVLNHIPSALTSAIGGMLRDTYELMGLRIGFVVAGLGIIGTGIMRWALLKETLIKKRVGKKRLLLMDSYAGMLEGLLKLHPLVKLLIALRAFILINAISMIAYFSILYVTRFTGIMSFTEWGLIASISSPFYLTALLIERLTKRFRVAPFYALLLIIQGLVPCLFLSNVKVAVFVALVLLNTSAALSYGIERAFIARIIEPSLRGRAESFMFVSFYVGMTIGSLLGGYLYAYHPSLVLMMSSILLFIGVVPGFLIFKKVIT